MNPKKINKVAAAFATIIFGLCALPMTGMAFFGITPAQNSYVNPADRTCIVEGMGAITNQCSTSKLVRFNFQLNDQSQFNPDVEVVAKTVDSSHPVCCRAYGTDAWGSIWSSGNVCNAHPGTSPDFIELFPYVPGGLGELLVGCDVGAGATVSRVAYFY